MAGRKGAPWPCKSCWSSGTSASTAALPSPSSFALLLVLTLRYSILSFPVKFVLHIILSHVLSKIFAVNELFLNDQDCLFCCFWFQPQFNLAPWEGQQAAVLALPPSSCKTPSFSWDCFTPFSRCLPSGCLKLATLLKAAFFLKLAYTTPSEGPRSSDFLSSPMSNTVPRFPLELFTSLEKPLFVHIIR